MYKKISVNKDKKMLMLGVTLHSIQDFYAHSYVSDLADFKDNKKTFKKRSNKIQAYHHDWVADWGIIVVNKGTKDKRKLNKRKLTI